MTKKIFLLFITCYCQLISTYPFSKLTIFADTLGDQCRGPGSVVRSLLHGLEQLHIPFNFNPKMKDIGETVVVLSNVGILRDCIKLKKDGRIRCLLAGPNLVNLPSDCNRLVMAEEIDLYLINCHWTKVAYEEDEPMISKKLRIWFAGVDCNYWNQSNKKEQSNDVLVYWKTEKESFIKLLEDILKKYGWNPIRLHYGNYFHPQYKEMLNMVKFAVFISKSESQGISLAEAWAMNIPTIVWNTKQLTYNGRVYSECSACPYLTEKTGKDWQAIDQFEFLVKNIGDYFLNFEPRKWVLENMSDEKSAQCLLDIIKGFQTS